MPDRGLYKVFHSSSEIKTVIDYVNDISSPAYPYAKDPERFLNIIGDDGLTNRQRIERGYKLKSEKEYIGAPANRLLLKPGIIFYLEYEKVNEQSFLTQGIEVVTTDSAAFKAAKLAELEADPGYFAINKPLDGELIGGISKQMFPELTVWIWCRSLSGREDETGELTGQIFDLTPFIMSCTTNVGKNGGNWTINLPAITCYLNQENKWTLKSGGYTEYESDNRTTLGGDGYVSQSQLFNEDQIIDGEIRPTRNLFLFNKMINSNDLIFIRHETLDIEKNQRVADGKRIFIDKSNLANRIYDMIGLVDSNTESVSPGTNDVTITIEGRDLSKLFIEDGTYFYALENSQGIFYLAGQSTIESSLVQRIFADGALNFIGLYQFTSIEYIFKYIIHQLSNIKVIPDQLLSSYEKSIKKEYGQEVIYDARNTKFLEIQNIVDKKNINKADRAYKSELTKGIWQIIKLVIDESVANRRLADSSFSTAQGSILNFLNSAAQEPLVEFYMDTYKDMYHLIVRKPPYDQKALISLIEGKVNTEDPSQTVQPAIVNIKQEDVLQESLMMNDSEVYSWYHFVPEGSLMGDGKSYATSYLPAVFFPEYADVFGSKPFQATNSYLPYVPYSKNNNNIDLDFRQNVEDLKYVIESNQYLPFTRKGTIVVNRDRRIKIGNLIRYESTGEIFFVDAVQHSYSIGLDKIEATTSIQVSRGMIEQLIYGVPMQSINEQTQYVGYFNIIDTRLNLIEKEFIRKYRREVIQPIINPANKSLNIENVELKEKTGNRGVHHLNELNIYPAKKNLFLKFINGINELGYWVDIRDALRSVTEQIALRRENRNNAAPGKGKHPTGDAIDINLIDIKTGKRFLKNTSEIEWRQTKVPQLANSLGLQWGGKSNNGKFGTYVDRVHFEIVGAERMPDNTKKDPVYVTETRTVKGLDLDKVFSNFKVNKFAFNFFLKKMQFDPFYKRTRSRVIYDNDGQVLSEVVVKGIKKKR